MAARRSAPRWSEQVVILLAAGLVLVLVTPTTLFMAVYPLGNSAPDQATACQWWAEGQPGGTQVDQTTPTSAERAWLPPRIICSIDSQRDGHPTTSVHQNLPATALAAVELTLLVVVCAWLCSIAVRLLRRRWSRRRA